MDMWRRRAGGEASRRQGEAADARLLLWMLVRYVHISTPPKK